jgi:hypothetical protein
MNSSSSYLQGIKIRKSQAFFWQKREGRPKTYDIGHLSERLLSQVRGCFQLSTRHVNGHEFERDILLVKDESGDFGEPLFHAVQFENHAEVHSMTLGGVVCRAPVVMVGYPSSDQEGDNIPALLPYAIIES